ncbi:MAG: hypothetical protein HC903_28530 [Methylacidiphilales bacterium]|nr:hypothetical protein [Candidatus Methylacidiphilales bacterium]
MSGNKPLGFFGCNYDYVLITDIMETWGDNLQNISDCDCYYLIHVASEYINFHYLTEDPTNVVDELTTRIIARELPASQVQALISAIVNKSSTKPLGYWGVDYQIPLIKDIYETYGDFLQTLTDDESYETLNALGWVLYCDNPSNSSEDADEVAGRLEELPLAQLQALIQALGN